MKIEVAGYRPNVIDNELYLLLDDFRAFRHKFRHTYAFEFPSQKLNKNSLRELCDSSAAGGELIKLNAIDKTHPKCTIKKYARIMETVTC
jgi:hypothetical protein